jgi:hypothetical protein
VEKRLFAYSVSPLLMTISVDMAPNKALRGNFLGNVVASSSRGRVELSLGTGKPGCDPSNPRRSQTTVTSMAGGDFENEHVERAMNAIALITAFSGVKEHGSLKAASLLKQLMGEEKHPEYLVSAVAALAAVLVNDLARATGTAPAQHLQALGQAAALLRA